MYFVCGLFDHHPGMTPRPHCLLMNREEVTVMYLQEISQKRIMRITLFGAFLLFAYLSIQARTTYVHSKALEDPNPHDIYMPVITNG